MFQNELYSNLSQGLYCHVGNNYEFKMIYVFQVGKPSRNTEPGELPYIVYRYWDFQEREDGTFTTSDENYIDSLVPITDSKIIQAAEKAISDYIDEKNEDMLHVRIMQQSLKKTLPKKASKAVKASKLKEFVYRSTALKKK